MPDLDTFLDDLSSAAPVPGGGSVAAIETAMAAALLAMVANLTIGRKRYAGVEAEATAVRDESLRLRDVARELAEEDVEAYGRVASVSSMPRDTESQKVKRRECMQATLKDAVQPPLEMMRLAARVVELSGELARFGNRSAISDVGTAAGAARAGYEAALLNVEINVAAIHDDEWNRGIRKELEAMPAVGALQEEIAQYVLAVIRE
ncbi:MAG TPA: cyclodeaminase/cyclohydrolase family protein [Chloroflexota bacterium]